MLLVLLAAAAAQALAADAPESAAQSAATTWLNLVDRGDYAQSWAITAEYFRNAVARGDWVARISHTRDPLGMVKARRLLSAQYQRSLPGAPDGEYVVIRYATSFENKADATETVTPVKEADGHWRVSGYYIR